jgi:hypothetical protein
MCSGLPQSKVPSLGMDSPSVGLISGAEAQCLGDLDSRLVVALPPASDLLLFAKHLFVATIAWQQCDLRRSCGSKKLSAEVTNSRKKKAPAVGAGGRARPGPKFAERIEHRPLLALHVGEMERAIFSLPHHRADTA